MTPERWQEVDRLLSQTRRQAPAERDTFLDQACGTDAELRREVESLLAFDDRPSLMDQPVFNVHADDPDIGFRIGPYRTLELLGRGGMGAVYLAARQDDYSRRVAIKLIKRGLASDEILRRFEQERQILADFDHPGIARLLDGGTTDDGRPYLVMEVVDGEPIDRYCDRRRLDIDRRLDLFLQVCAAVHMSHQHLVVHRDLKPSNILVTEIDGEPVPKLLDFGIAKALEEDPARGLETEPGQAPLTLKYAAPEQVQGERIGTAADTYALGILLYELLAGRHPTGLENPSTLAHTEVLRRICETPPKLPSLAVGADDEEAQARATNPRRLKRRLAGDLDAIALKALRKEPARRYGSVIELSEDIRRHQAGLPVPARQGTWIYRASRFVRRHRVGLAFVALVGLFALSGMALWLKAREEARRADHIFDVLVEVFDTWDPDRRPESLPESLEDIRARYLESPSLSPQQRAKLADVLGRTYHKMGSFEPAHELMTEALDAWRVYDDGDSPQMAKRLNNLAAFSRELGRDDEAERHLREALEMRRRLGQDEVALIKNMNNLASVLMGRGAFDEAEELYRQGLELRQGRGDEAATAASLQLSAGPAYLRGDFETAEPLYRQALELRRRVLGPEHTRTAQTLDGLANVLAAQGRLDEAEPLYQQALAIRRAKLGPHNVRVAAIERNLAALLLARPELDPSTLQTAGLLLRRAYATLQAEKPAGDRGLLRTESLLGAYWTRLGRFEAAEPCLLDSYEALKQGGPADALYARRAAARIAELYTRRQRPDEAAPFQAALDGAGLDRVASQVTAP